MNDKFFNYMLDIYAEQGNVKINNTSSKKEILLRLFLFFQYFDSDYTQIDELEETIVNFVYFKAVEQSVSDSTVFDLIHVFEDYQYIFSRSFDVFLQTIDTYFLQLFNGYRQQDMPQVRAMFNQMGILENTKLVFTILFDRELDFETKKQMRDTLSSYQFNTKNLDVVLLFEDDLAEIVSGTVDGVKYGKLQIADNHILQYGDEKSLVTSISAVSLKELYKQFGTRGLFDSNLRYYIKSAKIDAKIKESITNEPEKFWYFNNGLTITCTDYEINGNVIELKNFSIVNGGQTTNLVGNTDFDTDFYLLCKIIKKKYEDPLLNKQFLGQIAEATNTQKPIKARDLIANRIEQKLLRDQLGKAGIFMSLKRGVKIDRETYKEKWQVTSNEEVGQMLFSYIYQHPGIARNGKSKMIENEQYYQTIFSDQYDSDLIRNFLFIKVNYHFWKNYLKSYGSREMFGLAKNGFFFFLATIGFIAKYHYNEFLKDYLSTIDLSKDLSDDVILKNMLSYNDIGELPAFVLATLNTTNITVKHRLFDLIFNQFIGPAFKTYIQTTPGSGYSNFTKTDINYLRYVLPIVIKTLTRIWTPEVFRNEFGIYFNVYPDFVAPTPPLNPSDSIGVGILEELDNFRRKIYKKLNGTIKAYQIYTNKQMNKIAVEKPRTKEDLLKVVKLSKKIYDDYADEIVAIVAKYLVI